jgi:hypothetical protein
MRSDIRTQVHFYQNTVIKRNPETSTFGRKKASKHTKERTRAQPSTLSNPTFQSPSGQINFLRKRIRARLLHDKRIIGGEAASEALPCRPLHVRAANKFRSPNASFVERRGIGKNGWWEREQVIWGSPIEELGTSLGGEDWRESGKEWVSWYAGVAIWMKRSCMCGKSRCCACWKCQ